MAFHLFNPCEPCCSCQSIQLGDTSRSCEIAGVCSPANRYINNAEEITNLVEVTVTFESSLCPPPPGSGFYCAKYVADLSGILGTHQIPLYSISESCGKFNDASWYKCYYTGGPFTISNCLWRNHIWWTIQVEVDTADCRMSVDAYINMFTDLYVTYSGDPCVSNSGITYPAIYLQGHGSFDSCTQQTSQVFGGCLNVELNLI